MTSTQTCLNFKIFVTAIPILISEMIQSRQTALELCFGIKVNKRDIWRSNYEMFWAYLGVTECASCVGTPPPHLPVQWRGLETKTYRSLPLCGDINLDRWRCDNHTTNTVWIHYYFTNVSFLIALLNDLIFHCLNRRK